MDQAQSLREYMHRFNDQQQKPHTSRVITITSGKGGVGKSNFTLNFALGLKAVGKRVIILDLDLSTANINILMGITPRYSLVEVLHQRKYIRDVIEQGTEGIEYISGGLEIQDLLELDQIKLSFFWSQIQELQTYADFILLDTGAGVSKELVDFILASDETILVTTPEPTAMADSYAVLKTVLHFSQQAPKFRLVVNRAQTYREAAETSRSLQNACSHFLKLHLKTLGCLMEDNHVRQSVRSQTPFFISYPNCSASKSIKQIVYSYLPDLEEHSSVATTGIRGFFEKIISLGKSS
ncbi:cobyrinic acid a,c-diamide synthase [Bacillus sp. AFS073361]|uniref:MinD/ParA family protein n=1 Tax=Bacillus sp. AFS073361 TaxID=2033511 RepID=UPI000BF5581B|nr:MinD/ParA family protein [Bacillus sp. AFS073361]PFP30762.1 cobyrinic acid a,c-diamide synthase [Bacillus sp. AFS073361]